MDRDLALVLVASLMPRRWSRRVRLGILYGWYAIAVVVALSPHWTVG